MNNQLRIEYIFGDDAWEKVSYEGEKEISRKVIAPDKYDSLVKVLDTKLDNDIFNGKYKGLTIGEAIAQDAEFFQWMMVLEGKKPEKVREMELLRLVVPFPQWAKMPF